MDVKTSGNVWSSQIPWITRAIVLSLATESPARFNSVGKALSVRLHGSCQDWRDEMVWGHIPIASFHDFEDNFKLQEQLSGGSVVVVHEEPHPQMTGTLSYRPEETGGRQREKSLDTRHRRLDDRYRFLPWPEDFTEVHDALYGVYL
ncbi:hypothetical protein TNCV_1936541 [Trichonephila clavipes]|nr:hypothetical protein TNCV_1936541 [Trichonephila clavipes]